MMPRIPHLGRIAFLLIHVAAAFAYAQIPAPPQQQPIALLNATIHPVTSEPIETASILFDRGKIIDIGSDIEIPPDAMKIDLQGRHVYPGLIESRSQLGLTEIGAVDVTNDYAERGDINPSVRAEVAINPESEHIPVARANGIALAVAAPGGGLIAGRSALIMTDGWTWRQMTFKAPLAMVVNWPNMGMYADDDEASKQQRDRVRKRIEALDKAIEDASAYRIAAEAPETNERFSKTDVRWEAMVPVLRGELPVWIAADSLLEIESAVSWADKHKLKVVLVGGTDAWYYTDLLKQRDIPVVVTSVLSLPGRADAAFDEPFTLPLRLYKAGVRFCIASGGASAIRNLPYHAAKAAAYGLPKDEALKAITLYPAAIMGVADRVGSLEKGKDATLIVTDGDPLEITTRVHELFIQGRRIDLANKHRRLYDKYRQRYRQVDTGETPSK